MSKHALVFFLFASLTACGPSAGEDAGPDTTDDAGPGATVDAGPAPSDGGVDAGPNPGMDAGAPAGDAGPGSDAGSSATDAGGGTDAGAGGCGLEPTPPGRRVPPSCEEARCHGNDQCARLLLASWGFAGFTSCGATQSFDPASSRMACEDPPFFDYAYPPSCGRYPYRGTIQAYCAPDRSQVVAYFWGSATDPTSPFIAFDHFGHEYEAGPSGGSGTVSLGTPVGAPPTSMAFHGLQHAATRAVGAGFEPVRMRVWFQAQDLLDPTLVTTTGGFDVMLAP